MRAASTLAIALLCLSTVQAEELPLTTQGERAVVRESAVYSSADQALMRAEEANEPRLHALPPVDARRMTRHRAASWVSSVGVLLVGDRDHDGYYTGFSLTLDVDTDYAHSDVFVTLYLQLKDAALAHLHTTRDFRIYGFSKADTYRIEVELLDRYPAGHYDLVLDIHESPSTIRVDSVGPAQFRNLDQLPLESTEWGPPDDPVRVREHVGGSGPALLALLLIHLARRHRLGKRPPVP